MKLNTETKLLDPFGRFIIEQDGAPPLTLGVVCANAFIFPAQHDEQLEMAVKVQSFDLASRFAKGGEIELTGEELDKVRLRIGLIYHTAVAGAALLLLKEE